MKQGLKFIFNWLDRVFSAAFTPAWNPMYQLGALSFFYFWIVAVSGLYLFIFFETSISGAWSSVERITVDQWWLGGVMRSFHRYASAAMGVCVTLHLLREYALDRYSGVRWFSWFSGIPLLWLLFASAIGGYWLVWDQLAQYIAITTAEFLDALPVMVDPMASNFLNEDTLSDRLFSLLVFLHIGIPLALLLGMFIHIKRISGARSNPERGLAIGTLLAMLVVSLWRPALSQPPANLDLTVTEVGLDWVFLNPYPLIDQWGPGTVWALLVGLSLLLSVVPWLPRRKAMEKMPVAVVDPDNCNGCGWCLADCPYEAVTMKEHDYKKGHQQSVVNPDLCISCGICAGACPSSSPFRHVDELVTGISIPGFHIKELLSLTENKLATLEGENRVIVYGCDHGTPLEALESDAVTSISMPCSALLPPAFIDYVLRRGLVEGVMISGCCEGDCHYRLGNTWMDQRLSGERMPILRTRVPREKVRTRWLGAQGGPELAREIELFRSELSAVVEDEVA